MSYALRFFPSSCLLAASQLHKRYYELTPRSPTEEADPLKGSDCRFDSDRGYFSMIMLLCWQLADTASSRPPNSRIN